MADFVRRSYFRDDYAGGDDPSYTLGTFYG